MRIPRRRKPTPLSESRRDVGEEVRGLPGEVGGRNGRDRWQSGLARLCDVLFPGCDGLRVGGLIFL